MVILPPDLDPELVARLGDSEGGELARKMGIEFLELSATHSVARMPVEGNRQVVGLLHGGAHVVLGESLGSLSSAIHAGPGRYAVGIEINATHSRSVTEGWVTGTCTALVLGRTLCTHEIVMTDEAGRRLSTVRMTNMLRDERVAGCGERRAAMSVRRALLLGCELVDDGLRDVVHGEATVHRRLLDPAERLGLREPHLLVEQALRAVDELARLEALDHVGHLGLERHDLLVAAERDLDRRQEVVRGEGLHDVGERPGLRRALHELLLAERGEQHDGGDVVLGEALGSRDAVELGHLDVHDDEVGPQLGREGHGRLAVTGLSDDIEAVVAKDLDDVEPDEGLILGDDDATGSAGGLVGLTHPAILR